MSWGTFVHNPNIVRSSACLALENRLAALSRSGDMFAWYRYQGNTDGTAFDPLYTTDRSGNGNDLSLYGSLPVTFKLLDVGEPCACPEPNTVAQSDADKAFNYRVVSVGDTLYDGDPLTVGGIVQSTGQGSALGSAEVPVIGFTRFRNPSNGCYIYFEPDTQDLYLYYTRDDTGAIVRQLSTVTWPGYDVWMYLEFALNGGANSVKFSMSYLDADGVTEVNQTQTFALVGGGLNLWPYSSGVSTQIWNYNGLNTGLDVEWMYKWILKGNYDLSVGADKFFTLMNACEPAACYPYSCRAIDAHFGSDTYGDLTYLTNPADTAAMGYPIDTGVYNLIATSASKTGGNTTSAENTITKCNETQSDYVFDSNDGGINNPEFSTSTIGVGSPAASSYHFGIITKSRDATTLGDFPFPEKNIVTLVPQIAITGVANQSFNIGLSVTKGVTDWTLDVTQRGEEATVGQASGTVVSSSAAFDFPEWVTQEDQWCAITYDVYIDEIGDEYYLFNGISDRWWHYVDHRHVVTVTWFNPDTQLFETFTHSTNHRSGLTTRTVDVGAGTLVDGSAEFNFMEGEGKVGIVKTSTAPIDGEGMLLAWRRNFSDYEKPDTCLTCGSLKKEVYTYSTESLFLLDTIHATTAGVETEITFPVDVGTETLKLVPGTFSSTTTLTSEGQAIEPCDPADDKYSMTVTNVAATSFPQLVLDNRSTKNGVNFAYGIKNARGLTEVITTGAAYPVISRDIRITSSRGVLDVFFEIQASNTVDNVSSTYDAGIRLGFNSFSELEGNTFSSVSEDIGSFNDLGLLSSGGIFPDYAVMGVNFSYSNPSVVSGGGFYKFQIDIVAELILWENYESQLPGTGLGRVRTITLNKTVYAGGYSLGGGIPTGVSIASMTDTRLFDDSTLALPFLVTKDSDFTEAEIRRLGTAFTNNR